MKPVGLRRFVGISIGAMTLIYGSSTLADVGPSVEIKMPLNSPQAVSGREYGGMFLVRVGDAGTLSDFEFLGAGWTVLSFKPPQAPIGVQPGVIEIPFRAIPQDANAPVGLALTFNGRLVRQTYEIGPRFFARRGELNPVYRVHSDGSTEPFVPGPTSDMGPDEAAPDEGGGAGRGTLRVTGRIVYQRPDGEWVGAAWLDVEVRDNDDIGHDDIWNGYTDAYGYFDTGVVTPEDDPDGPDLILFFETETAVADVTDNTIYESTYEWETDEITDYTGSAYNYGTLTVATDLMPTLHIFSSLTRAHMMIYDWTNPGSGGLITPKVQVEWPDDSRGDNQAWYEYYSDMSEIHLSTGRSWMEDTHTHEYGHHFMHMYSYDPPDPEYCNDPGPAYCDYDSGVPGCYASPASDCGHCAWCPETDHDAWNEAWPNWLADVVTRSYPLYYQFDDDSPYTAWSTRSDESITACCQDGAFHDPFLTEGFVGALLRDIEDDTQDDQNGDGIWDSLCTGVGPLFDIQVNGDPRTASEFISLFRSWYPEHAALLYPTAFNVSPQYVTGYAADTQPPGVVPSGDSPTHPIGVGGPLPCISVEWSHAPDDVRGTCAYSYEWTTNPAGQEPDEVADPTLTSGCYVTTSAFASPGLGAWYFSVKAQDCAGNWSPQWATFGPFEVTDCNNSGVNDVCDTACNHLGIPEVCEFSPGWCNFSGCGNSEDCNGNYAPDECDITSGFSEDCNRSGVPDECENMFHWAGGDGPWGLAGNWEENQTPTPNSEVCIDVPGGVTVTHTNGAYEVGTLACSESVDIAGGSSPWAQLTVNDKSWVDGALGLSGNNSVLTVNDRLEIGGLFTWTGSNVTNSAKLTGSGTTFANGGVQISDVVHLDGHRLVLDGSSTSVVSTGRIGFIGPSVFEIRPGSTYEHQGSGYIFSGWFSDQFVNQGTLIKSVDPGSSTIYMFTNNSGLIHVQAGTLRFYLYSSSTGDFLADPGTTLEFNGGGHQFLVGSSIVAEHLLFSSGAAGVNDIRGTYNVSGSLHVSGHALTIHPEANVVDFGDTLTVASAAVYFKPVLGTTIVLDAITLSTGPTYSGSAYFDGGDPVETETLTIGPGDMYGPALATVSGLLTWNGGGGLYRPGATNADGGILVNPSGSQNDLVDRTLNNAATATFFSGISLSGTAVFNNLPGALIDIRHDSGATVIGGGKLNNAGTLVKSVGTGTSWISSQTTNTGIIEIQTGTLMFYTYYGYFYRQTAGQTILNGGQLGMMGPAPVQIDGGLLTGAGTITGNVVNAGGFVEPGLGVGRLDVVGAYTQAAGGSLKVDLGGSPEGQYDVLACTGGVAVAGDLEVVLINGFVPDRGDIFRIVRGGSVTGEFEHVTVTNLPPQVQVAVYYSPTAVTLIVLPVDGDCDEDYVVGLGDLSEFVPCLAGPEGGLGQDCACADMNGDSDVDLHDLALYQVDFTGPLP